MTKISFDAFAAASNKPLGVWPRVHFRTDQAIGIEFRPSREVFNLFYGRNVQVTLATIATREEALHSHRQRYVLSAIDGPTSAVCDLGTIDKILDAVRRADIDFATEHPQWK